MSRLSRYGFVGAAAAYAATAGAARAQTLFPLRGGTNPNDDVVSCLYAQQSGIFRRLGLDVALTASNSGSAVAAAVVGGTLNFGKSSVLGLITAHARGIPFTWIAPAGEYSADAPNAATIVRVDSPIRTARDLNGKTVAVTSLKGSEQITTMAWIDKNGGDSTSVNFVEMTQSQDLEALDSGRVDAATITDPLLQNALETKRARLLADTLSTIGDRYLLAAYFTTLDFARSHRDAVEHFATGIAEGARYTNAHHAQTVPLIAAFTSMQPAVIERMTRVRCGERLSPELIQPSIDVAAKYKTIPARFDAREVIFGG